jgi:hypothetical protein
MPEIIECPQCHRKLRMDESVLGQTVQCPSCQNAFTAALPYQPAPPPRPRPLEDDEPIFRPKDEPPRPRYDSPPPRPRHDSPPRRRYEDEDEDYPRPRRSRFGDYQRPHRGVAVLTLGILSIVLFFSLPGLIMAIVAVVMGASDLAAMNRGEMNEDGRGQTKAGLICGIIAMALEGLALFTCIGFGVLNGP